MEALRMSDLIFKDEVFAIVGAAMEVHKQLGCGFAEPVYQECLEIEYVERKIVAAPQKELPVFYKGRQLKKSYLADFLVYGQIIVEIKALDQLTSREDAQVINYLKASGFELGVLINFGARSLEWKRLVKTGKTSSTADLQK
jgi:GxxExxY protein